MSDEPPKRWAIVTCSNRAFLALLLNFLWHLREHATSAVARLVVWADDPRRMDLLSAAVASIAHRIAAARAHGDAARPGAVLAHATACVAGCDARLCSCGKRDCGGASTLCVGLCGGG